MTYYNPQDDSYNVVDYPIANTITSQNKTLPPNNVNQPINSTQQMERVQPNIKRPNKKVDLHSFYSLPMLMPKLKQMMRST